MLLTVQNVEDSDMCCAADCSGFVFLTLQVCAKSELQNADVSVDNRTMYTIKSCIPFLKYF